MTDLDRWRDHWANLHPFWRFLLAMGLVACLLLSTGRPILSLYRGWSADHHLNEARLALASNRHAHARDLSLRILRGDAPRQEAVPILLHATDFLGDPRRTEVAKSLLAGADFDEADRLFAWEILCRSASMRLVLSTWPELPANDQSRTAFLAPLLDRMIGDEMNGEAARLLRQRPEPLPADLEVRLMRLLLAKGTDEAFRQFQVSLIGRLTDHPSDAEPLASMLDEIPQENLLPGISSALSSWQTSYGSRDIAAALRLARCEMAADRQHADEIFATALALHRDADPIATARWCVQTRRLREARSLLASQTDPHNPEVFNLRRLVCEQTGDAEAWAALLADPPSDAFLPEILCERAYVAQLMEDSGARKATEDEALRTAAAFPADDALIRLARSAGSRGLADLAQRAWIEAIRRRSGPLPLANRLKPLVEGLATSKRETELLEILTSYRFIEPENPVIRVQHGYLSCLSGHTTPSHLIRDLRPVHNRLPDALPVRCVLALAHLLEHRHEEATALTDGKEIDWGAASPAYRAIRGIALAASGRGDEAAAFLDQVSWDDLLPSEKRVLRGLEETSGRPTAGTGEGNED